MEDDIKLILIEDHPDYRDVIKIALNKEQKMQLTHSFGYAERAIRHLEHCPHSERPHVVLLDLKLPGISGLQAIPWIQKATPNTKIIIISQSDQEADVLKAIQLGVSSYLLKTSSIEQIVECITSVVKGRVNIDPGIAHHILNSVQQNTPQDLLAKPLSARELQILKLLATGLLKKEISDQLDISLNTVAKHIGNIYEKLQVKNAPSAVSKAYRSGILSVGKE